MVVCIYVHGCMWCLVALAAFTQSAPVVKKTVARGLCVCTIIEMVGSTLSHSKLKVGVFSSVSAL